MYRCNINFLLFFGRVFILDLLWYNSLYEDGSVEEIKLLLKRLCLFIVFFSKFLELFLGDIVIGSVTLRFIERLSFFIVIILIWILIFFLVFFGFFFSFFVIDGLKYFERSFFFFDRNVAKVKSGFDVVVDVFCT